MSAIRVIPSIVNDACMHAVIFNMIVTSDFTVSRHVPVQLHCGNDNNKITNHAMPCTELTTYCTVATLASRRVESDKLLLAEDIL